MPETVNASDGCSDLYDEDINAQMGIEGEESVITALNTFWKAVHTLYTS